MPAKTCPQCGITGDIEELFGYRSVGPSSVRPQGWCKKCRHPYNKRTAGSYTHTKRMEGGELNFSPGGMNYVYEVGSTEWVKWKYKEVYPNDNTRRSVPTMRAKLAKRGFQ